MTTVAAMIAWLTVLSVSHRAFGAMHSGDTLLRLLLLILVFSPSGTAMSVDWWLDGAHGELYGVTDKIDPWTQRLMQLQVSLVYLVALSWKLRGEKWRRGTAAWYPMMVAEFRRFRIPAIPGQLVLARFVTWGTLVGQVAMGVTVWIPMLRYWSLAVGVAMHVGMATILRLQLFMPIMLASYIVFVPGEQMVSVIEWLVGSAGSRP